MLRLVIVLLAATPSDAELSAAIEVLVEHWQSRASGDLLSMVAAEDLVNLSEQLDHASEAVIQQQAECLRSGNSICGPAASHRPTRPSDDALARALATLGKASHLDKNTLARVVMEALGFTSLKYARQEDELRLAGLLARVKLAGTDLRPLFQPELNSIENEACDLGRIEVWDRLQQLIIEDTMMTSPPRSGAVRGVKNYTIESKVSGVQVTFIARGSGPMKGDVLSTERGYATVTTDACATKRGPPLGAPRPARDALNASKRR